MADNPIYRGWPWQQRLSIPSGYLTVDSVLYCTFRFGNKAPGVYDYRKFKVWLTLETGSSLTHSITGGGADDIIQIDIGASTTKDLSLAERYLVYDLRLEVSGDDNDIYLGPPIEVEIVSTVTDGEGFDV